MFTDNFKHLNPELEVEIYYLTEEEGGRKNPIYSGYRGQFFYNGRDWDASQELIDKEICNMGETATISLQTLSPHFHIGQFHVGQKFLIREGTLTVGLGTITRVIREDFKYWNFDTFFNNLPTDCKSYDHPNTDGFIIEVQQALAKIKQIGRKEFIKTLSDKHKMLTVECNLQDKSIGARELVNKLSECWRDEIAFKNSFYKIDLQYFESNFSIELTFATWHSLYLTGKIIVFKYLKNNK